MYVYNYMHYMYMYIVCTRLCILVHHKRGMLDVPGKSRCLVVSLWRIKNSNACWYSDLSVHFVIGISPWFWYVFIKMQTVYFQICMCIICELYAGCICTQTVFVRFDILHPRHLLHLAVLIASLRSRQATGRRSWCWCSCVIRDVMGHLRSVLSMSCIS